MLRADDVITQIDHDADVDVVVVRTERETDFEDKLKKKNPYLGLCPGYGVRRFDGGGRGHRLAAGRAAHRGCAA